MRRVLIIIMLSLCCGLHAQKLYHSQHLRFEQITVEDGLPGNSAHAFMQDRLGYLWMGTFNGLVRYDGIELTVFKENATENSIKGKFITSIFEDSRGKIWIGTMFSGLNSYEPRTGVFTYFPYDPAQKNTLIWPYVTSINEDALGRIWVSTINGLNCLEKDSSEESYHIHTYFPSLYSETLFQAIDEYRSSFPTFEIAQVGSNAQLKETFTVENKTFALLVHMGESVGKGKLSDQGWLENEQGEKIWKADVSKSRQDGSNYKKRIQIETIELAPGRYELAYQSDEDFSYNDFYFPKEVRPLDGLTRKDFPEHDSVYWGIKVILLSETAAATIQKTLKAEDIPFSHTISNARIYDLFKDDKKQLWIGSAGGLSQIQLPSENSEPVQFQHYPIHDEYGEGLKSNLVMQIQQKDKETFWVTGMSYNSNKELGLTIEHFKPQDNSFKTIYKNETINAYTQVLETANKNIWLASFGHGLHSLTPSYQKENVFDYELQKYTMPNDFVWQLYQDASGVIWAGTWQAGGFKLNSSVNIFPFYKLEDNTNISTEKLAVYAVLEDREGDFWLGTKENGLYKWDRKTHLFEHYTSKDGLIEGTILSLEEDRYGNVWIGTNEGLCRYHPGNDNFKTYIHQENNENSLNNNFVHAIEEDAVGRLWIGTRKGLCLYQAENDNFINIPTFHEDNGVETNRINKITASNDGDLWIAYYFEGLVKVKADDLATNLKTKQIKFFFKGKELDIIDMYLDESAQLWLGDHQMGLQMLDTKTEEEYHFPRKDKAALNNVSAIAADQKGHLWLSNSKGFSVFNKEKKSYKTYNKDDGIHFDFAIPGPSFRTGRGELLVGGVNGFYLFHPDSIKAPAQAPKVTFTNIKLFNESIEIGEKSPLKKHISYTKEINLTYDQNAIAISYAGLHYDKPKRIQYAYKLEGVDKDWVKVEEEKMARYANLPPGSFVFKVKAANRGGDWSTEIAELTINISPPWWQTIWFYSLMLCAMIAIIIVIHKFQLKRQLEKAEASRLKELDEMKSRFFVNVAHELRTPLTLIMGPLSSIVKRGSTNKRTSMDLKIMRSNGQFLMKLINEILELSRLEANRIELKEKPTLIYSILHRAISAFESGAQYRNIQLSFNADFDKRLQILLDVSKFEKIVFNLIINALKFTPKGGSVTIRGKDTGSHIRIEVQDTGQGIFEDDLPRIFDRFYQSNRPNALRKGGTGVGLALSKQFAELLGGSLTAESTLGEGSTFIFTFPKKEVFGVPEELMPVIEKPDLEIHAPWVEAEQEEEADLAIIKTKAQDLAHILVVEDNPDMQIYINSVLEESYKVTITENGQEALDWLKVRDANPEDDLPSLIISDVMMPVMDGFTLLEKVKENIAWKSIPVIMLTARIEKEDRLRALRIGVDDYLTKPFEQDELFVRIENLLINYRSRQAALREIEEERWKESTDTDATVLATEEKTGSSKGDIAWLENLEKVVKDRVGDAAFTVSQLAYDLHISERQIYRKIKELTGLSPNKYLKEVRLQTARMMLENQECSTVKEACYSVGFRKVSYFSKQYQKRFGKLPSEVL